MGFVDISIHAPLAGRDLSPASRPDISIEFQSTRPLRGATFSLTPLGVFSLNFNPRAPCGARRISSQMNTTPAEFQSTRPLRGATLQGSATTVRVLISIHAPLAGRDLSKNHLRFKEVNFNPRAPCGARLSRGPVLDGTPLFQSTRPLRGATRQPQRFSGIPPISIHAPLAGRDQLVESVCIGKIISIHAPLAGRDREPEKSQVTIPGISIHAPLAGRDSKFDEFLSANLHKSNKRDLLSEEKMRHSLPQTAHVSHFRSFLGAKLQRFSARLPFALRS